tara:strand:- start:21389 stop:22708 length:1320 start_codon:yes stop_codon:yes gene_type:complete
MSKITCIDNDYMDFLYNNLSRIEYPFKNPGFNLSFSKINNKHDIFVIRNVFPFKIITNNKNNKKLIPGISKKHKKLVEILGNDLPNTLFSNNFIWDWNNWYESNILFVGKLEKNGHIKVNNKIKPISIIDPLYNYPIPKHLEKGGILKWQHKIRKEDFRLLNIKNKTFIMDSHNNTIDEVELINNKIIIGRGIKYYNICFYNFNKNVQTKFYKTRNIKSHLPKNWSLYNTKYKNGLFTFYFFHNYNKMGISAIMYNKNECNDFYIVKYNNDPIPYNDNDSVIRLSFGSTILKKRNYYYGVGHFKCFYKPKDINDKNKHIYNKYILIIKELSKKNKNKNKNIRLHPSKMYGYYYFRYDEKSNEFLLSNGFFLFTKCTKYIIPLCFPMSIEERYNNVYISMGYGDYTNLIMKTSIKEIDKLLIHDAKEFDLKKFDLQLNIL